MIKNYIRKPNTSCALCGNKIYRRPSQIGAGKVYCSKACFNKASRKESPCIVCGKPILAGLNKKTCSRGCSNVNRTGTIYKMGRPKDKVVGQRAIKLRVIAARGSKCERCGYGKVEILHVHHRDRNRKNNDLTNLELICPNCHYEEHYLEKSWLGGKVQN